MIFADLAKELARRWRLTSEDAKTSAIILAGDGNGPGGSVGRLDDRTTRFGRPEANVTQIQVTLAEHSLRMDRVDSRLTHIEKRLDRVEA